MEIQQSNNDAAASLPESAGANPVAAAATSSAAAPAAASQSSEGRLSYKFQRLREKLRAAIDTGELSGKLPGERQLARRFRVNAKTLSKALTDLAAEGLLERSIGRGTFVKGSDPEAAETPVATDRWLIVCPPSMADSPVVKKLTASNPLAQIVHDTASLRPSFLSTFKAVIDFDPATPLGFLRDLVVRNAAVVLVGREPSTYSMNAVLVDRTLGASLLARDLMLAGHRRFVSVERQGSTQICDAIRGAARRYAPEATADVAYAGEVTAAIAGGATAIVCDSLESAREVRALLAKEQIDVPGRVSLTAVGAVDDEYPCSGYFVSAEVKVQAILQTLRDSAARRPTTLWLTGKLFDAGTMGPIEWIRGAGEGDTAGVYETMSS